MILKNKLTYHQENLWIYIYIFLAFYYGHGIGLLFTWYTLLILVATQE